jgi:hypothetical protein
MSSRRAGDPDPFDELRAHDPASLFGEASPDSDVAQQAFDRIVATPRLVPRRRGHLAAAVAAVALLAGTAGGAWAIARYDGDDRSVSCFEDADLSSQRVEVVVSSATAGEAACAVAWTAGAFGTTETAPVLAGCTLADGDVGYFPAGGGAPCARLGLVVAMPGDLSDDPTAAFRDEVIRALDAECLSIDEATAVVGDAAARRKLDWQVQSPTTVPSRTCASPAFDDERRVVALVPIPAP